ncbi:hypothetical protein D3C84_944200 [compost metagenome]
MVWLCALETGQKRVVNVDGFTRDLLAEIVGEDLHITGEYHQISAGFIDHLHQSGFLLSLGFLGYRQVDESNALTLGHVPQVKVVGDDGGDGHVHLALVVAVEQVCQAVVELAHHQQHTHGLAGVVQFPLHIEALGDFIESGL